VSRTSVIRYRTRPDAADENARLVEAVYAALAERRPRGLEYATYRLDDGVTFVHIASLPDTENPLATLPEFVDFQREITERCIEQPVPSGATVVGSYADRS
jgi:dipeptidyl aminopeptidase/acylaminoacyl peptidase